MQINVTFYFWFQLKIIAFSSIHPFDPDVFPDPVDHDPEHGDEHTHGNWENIFEYVFLIHQHVVEGDSNEANGTKPVKQQPRNDEKADDPCDTYDEENIDGKDKQNSRKDMRQIILVTVRFP